MVLCVKNTHKYLHLTIIAHKFVSKIRKMEYLNLDPLFQPFDKSIDFEIFTFNGGEPHLKINPKIDSKEPITITTRISQFNNLGFLLLANDALRRIGVKEIHLFLPYFPGARQDRIMIKGEPLTVKIYADLINHCHFESVTIVDPHSEVAGALINKVRIISNHHFVKQCLEMHDLQDADYQLISPDEGALKKVYQLGQFLENESIIACGKKRNVATGKLSGFTIYAEDLEGKTGVIVDDICDGGGTFIGLAKELKKKNAGNLILVVTHGIFSRGLEELSQYFSKIYCTNSFSNFKHNSLIQIPISNGLLSE